MSDKHKDIAMLFVMLFVASIFAFAMVKWPDYMDSEYKVGRQLFYLTVAFVMYVFSFVFLLLSRGFWAKVGSSVAFSVFCVNLYVEIFLDPKNWTDWDMWLIPSVALNLVGSLFLIEKIKKK